LGLTEKSLGRLAAVLRTRWEIEGADGPGAGAAGGLGFGLMAFADGKIESGFDLFARHSKLKSRIRGADLVLTGEGALDAQTQMGKGVGQIARWCRAGGVPCFGLAGTVGETVHQSGIFSRTGALVEMTDPARAKSEAQYHLAQLAQQAAKEWCRGIRWIGSVHD
jgi:glycerate kinase